MKVESDLKIIQKVSGSVKLTLDLNEAAILTMVCGNVLGIGPIRNFTDLVYNKLREIKEVRDIADERAEEVFFDQYLEINKKGEESTWTS